MQFELLKSLAQEGPVTAIVNGDCMQRTMPEGVRVRLEYKSRYWPGDVIAFKRGDGKIVCHRLLGYVPGRNGWRVITRAENTRRVDVPVHLRLVVGMVTGVDGDVFRARKKDRMLALGQYLAAIIRRPVERFGMS